MNVLQQLRTAKHRLWLAYRKMGGVKRTVVDGAYRQYDRLVPYTFDVQRHRDRYGALPRLYFLHREPPSGATGNLEPAPRRIFCFWTGDNPLSDPRIEALRRLGETGTPVELITPLNLPEWLVAGHPLHPRYEQLSLNHRSDYLRAYFMLHHGGGYSDIKTPRGDWAGAFDLLKASSEGWLVGYPEVSSRSCGGDDFTALGRDIHRRFARLAGIACIIMKPRTPFAAEWVREIERRLDYYGEELAQHPGGMWGEGPGYPLRWIELGSDIFHPLQLKYHRHVLQSHELLPEFGGQR